MATFQVSERTHHLRAGMVAVIATAVTATAVTAGVAFITQRIPPDPHPTLRNVRTVPALSRVADRAAVVVRTESGINVFVPVDARGDPIAFCPGGSSAGIFVTALWGSVFDLDGRKIAGPAPRDLDRYRTLTDEQGVTVYPEDTIKGRGHQPAAVGRLRWSDQLTLTATHCPPRPEVDRLAAQAGRGTS